VLVTDTSIMAPVSVDERASLLPSSGSPRRIVRANSMFPSSTTYTSIGDVSPLNRRRGSRVLPQNSTGLPPAMGRKLSRIRTNSVSILNDDGDDIIATSFGPVLLADAPTRNRDWMLGWFLAIISGVLFTANNFFVKYLNLDALEMLLVRSFLQTVLVLIGILSSRTKLMPHSIKDRVLVVLQGLLSGARVFLQFACLSFMPLGDALTLVFTEPLWTIILSKIVLKIEIGWWKTIFGVFLLSGMVLCIQPPFIFPPEDNNGTTTLDPTTTTAYTTDLPTTTTPFYTTAVDFNTTTLPFTTSVDYDTTTLPFLSNTTTTPFTTAVDYNATTMPFLSNTTTTPFTTAVDYDTTTLPFLSDTQGRPWPKLEKLVEASGLKKLHDSYAETDHVTGPAYGIKYYIGVILALSTAVIGSTANVIIAKCECVSSSVMVFYSGLGGVVLALAFSFMDPNNRIIFNIASIPYDEWLILVMLGGSGLIGYYSMTRSLQLIPPTTVAVLRALEIILAYIAQAVVMGEVPNTLAITGSTIVMFSVIAFALEETIMTCYRCF
jgi:drug/metabolite transporter (DMT)-like permease